MCVKLDPVRFGPVMMTSCIATLLYDHIVLLCSEQWRSQVCVRVCVPSASLPLVSAPLTSPESGLRFPSRRAWCSRRNLAATSSVPPVGLKVAAGVSCADLEHCFLCAVTKSFLLKDYIRRKHAQSILCQTWTGRRRRALIALFKADGSCALGLSRPSTDQTHFNTSYTFTFLYITSRYYDLLLLS